MRYLRAGEGELPPGWDYDQAADGEYFFIDASGATTWDDPREDVERYVAEFRAAHARGVDIEHFFD